MLPAPRQKTPNISPIFKAHSNPQAISASKDGELRQSTPRELIIEEARCSSGAAAEADSGPYMTSGPDPPWRIYGDPFTSRLRQTRRAVARVRTPMALGGHLLPRSPTTC